MAYSTGVIPSAVVCLQARGIKFYDVPTSLIGELLTLHLEPYNPKDDNCIAQGCAHFPECLAILQVKQHIAHLF